MNLDKLYEIIRETTAQFRKGEEFQGSPAMVAWAKRNDPEEEAPGGVLEIYDMPPVTAIAPDADVFTVDCHFIVVAVHKKLAEEKKAALIELLEAPELKEAMAKGPSYIEIGGIIGDQGAAFQLFALGKVLGLWNVITPAFFGAEGDQADQMAGMGYIMMSPYPKMEAVVD